MGYRMARGGAHKTKGDDPHDSMNNCNLLGNSMNGCPPVVLAAAHVKLCNIILYYIILYYVKLCNIMLYYTILS